MTSAARRPGSGAEADLFPWVPVALAVGIGGYFALRVEPAVWALAGLAGAGAALLVLRRRIAECLRLPLVAVILVLAGLLLAAGRAHMVAAPVLPFRYYGPVEGRIVDIDRSFSDAVRLTLDEVRLNDVVESKVPARVRVALHGDQAAFPPMPGARVMLTAHLAPPEGPTEPGGFDFQRLAWFSRLGAVGYTRTPVLLAEVPGSVSLSLLAFRARMHLSAAMQRAIPGQAGALSSAFMTGDRSAVTEATNEVMRASNLSHMISISGLHMGLLVGFVFALVRYGLAAVPPVALRVNGKKVAAALALIAATAYLALAGPDVATRRAYVMAAVMLVAVLADRRAISLRSVAIAALIVLALEPESLVEPGFQMSFGATAALVAAWGPWVAVQERVPWWLRPAAALVLSSVVAGMATGPIAAAHFNRVAEYGLLANLLAVPVMGLVVMPAGVLAALAAPFGLASLALWVMGKGTEVILLIAAWVAGMEGAVRAVPAPHPLTLALFGLGGAAVILGPRRVRASGVAVAVAGLALWTVAERPQVLIASDGGLVGVMTEGGRALSKPKGAGFVAESWLEDDGDAADQEAAFARGTFSGEKGQVSGVTGGVTFWHLTGKTAAERAVPLCAGSAVVVIGVEWDGEKPGGCTLIDALGLRATGALALEVEGGALTVTSAREVSGDRLWNTRPARPERERRYAQGQ